MSDAEIEGATLQICKIGDSVGLILPSELLSRLNLKEGDALYPVRQPDGSLLLTPHKPKHARAMEIARKVMHDYRDTFTALAK
ncbi:AbrB/MazE/SpoVT family DNA-binding domain-containing protein [Bradyrhizobium sp.]